MVFLSIEWKRKLYQNPAAVLQENHEKNIKNSQKKQKRKEGDVRQKMQAQEIAVFAIITYSWYICHGVK